MYVLHDKLLIFIWPITSVCLRIFPQCVHELIHQKSYDMQGKREVGGSPVSSLLAVISRGYPRFLPSCSTECIALALVVLNRDSSPQNTTVCLAQPIIPTKPKHDVTSNSFRSEPTSSTYGQSQAKKTSTSITKVDGLGRSN